MVYFEYMFDRLNFNHHLFFDQQVYPITNIDFDPIINHG